MDVVSGPGSGDAWLRDLFDSVDEAFARCEMILDADGHPIDYRFLEVNAPFLTATGLLDPVGGLATELIPGLERSWVDTYARVGLGGEKLRFVQESPVMGRWFDVFAVSLRAPREFALVFRDITLQHDAEEQLRVRAGHDAYRARLVDALRPLEDPVEVQAVAARLLGEHLGASRALYCNVDDDDARLATIVADYHPGTFSIVGTHVLDDFGQQVMAEFRDGLPVVITDARTDPRLSAEERATTEALNVRAHVLMPLFKAGRPVAGLVAHSVTPRLWTPEELDLIAETADRTWGSIRRLEADRDLRTRRERAELTAEILGDLAPRDTEEQMQRLVDQLVPKFADYATVETPSRTGFLRSIAHQDPSLVETLRSLRHRRASVETDGSFARMAVARDSHLLHEITPEWLAALTSDPETLALASRLHARSQIAVPLTLDDDAGMLIVGISDPLRALYTQDDLDFLAEVAQRVEVMLTEARVRRQEHDIAVRLQRALLPDRVVQHPALPIEARYFAAGELMQVGGDWYDTFEWPDGRIGLIVGDVMGHNLDSAAAMGRLRAATSALATRVPSSPAAMLDALDEFAGGPDGADFVTVVCVVVDPVTGVLTYSSAGHPPPIVLPLTGKPVRLEGALNPPLCDFGLTDPAEPRPEATYQLKPGSVVLLYSDGLVERRDASLEDGLARLERTAGRLVAGPLMDVADRVVSEMTADSPGSDDVVVACFRWAPTPLRLPSPRSSSSPLPLPAAP